MAQKRTRRTKAQIEQSKGLGDTVEKVFKVTGIDKVAKFVLGEDCGCDERKAKLNAMFPYLKPECLTEQEHEFLTEWFATNRNSVKPSEQRELLNIYNRVFHQQEQPTSCGTCLAEIVNKLKKVYNNYEN